MDKWLHDIKPLKEGDCVAFFYKGIKKTGFVTSVTDSCFTIRDPTGGNHTVWLADIISRVPRANWPGLYNHLVDKRSVDQCNKLIEALDYIVQYGNEDQRGKVISSLRAAHEARDFIQKYL